MAFRTDSTNNAATQARGKGNSRLPLQSSPWLRQRPRTPPFFLAAPPPCRRVVLLRPRHEGTRSRHRSPPSPNTSSASRSHPAVTPQDREGDEERSAGRRCTETEASRRRRSPVTGSGSASRWTDRLRPRHGGFPEAARRSGSAGASSRRCLAPAADPPPSPRACSLTVSAACHYAFIILWVALFALLVNFWGLLEVDLYAVKELSVET